MSAVTRLNHPRSVAPKRAQLPRNHGQTSTHEHPQARHAQLKIVTPRKRLPSQTPATQLPPAQGTLPRFSGVIEPGSDSPAANSSASASSPGTARQVLRSMTFA